MQIGIAFQLLQETVIPTQDLLDLDRTAVAASQPNHLGRQTLQATALDKVGILRDDVETMELGVMPDNIIRGPIQADQPNLIRFWLQIGQNLGQPVAEILVEKQFHADATTTPCSRSAA